MPYGIFVANSNNVMQIDSDFSNMAIYASGSFAGSADSSPGFDPAIDRYVDIALPNIAGIKVFVHIPSGADLIFTTSMIVPGNTIRIKWQSVSYATISYLLLVPSSYFTSLDTGWGMNIYRADGNLAYSTNLDYVNIIGFLSFNPRTDGSLAAYSAKSVYMDLGVTQYCGNWYVYDGWGGYNNGDLYPKLSYSSNTVSTHTDYDYFVALTSVGCAPEAPYACYGGVICTTGTRHSLIIEY
jgi:hypothetical protein